VNKTSPSEHAANQSRPPARPPARPSLAHVHVRVLAFVRPRSGENVMSITYAPGARGGASDNKHGYMYVAWESHDTGRVWTPAACNPYIRIDFDLWA
jgi:hypothetical protein